MTDVYFMFLAILSLGVLIFVHELGHFLLAKWNGVGVLEFAIGFGKPLKQVRYGETTYSLRAIPLGGFVRMIGDDPRLVERASGRPSDELDEEEQELYEDLLAQKDRWFLSQGYFAKAAIVVAGPLFNILFAVILSVLSYSMFGKPVPIELPVIGDTMPGDPAHKAGLLRNDRVVSIDGTPVNTWDEMAERILHSGGKELALIVERANESGELYEKKIAISATQNPNENYEQLEDSSIQHTYRIGVFPKSERIYIPLGESLVLGTKHVWYLCRMTLRGLGKMVVGAISPKQLSGPISIISYGKKAAETGVDRLIDFAIFLSVSLAILNLLPIPILDGGHLMFFTIELLRGAPLSLRIQEWANQVGLVVLLLLMVFAIGNDVISLLPL